MRFDTPVFFQKIVPGEYEEDTGNYAQDTVTETKRYASVTSSGTAALNLVYGELKQDSLTVRLQNRYEKSFDRIRIGEKLYRADMNKLLPRGQILIVSEVQRGKNHD